MSNGAPIGNLAQYINNVTGSNVSAINPFSSLLGTLADVGGTVGFIASIVNLFNPNQPDQYIAQELQAIKQYLVQLYNDLEARFLEQNWQNLSELVSGSETVVQSLPTILSGQGPQTDPLTQVEECLNPVNALTDTTLNPTGNFFFSTYSSMTYWTDAGLYVWTYNYIDADGNEMESSSDVGYGTQAPPQPANDQIFSYLYVLPYCIKAYAALMVTGVALYPDFGTNTLWQSALISFAQFLTTIHNTIAGGITKLTPPAPSSQDWWASIMNSAEGGPSAVTGLLPATTGSNITFIVGAVEIYSGYSSINNKLVIQVQYSSPPSGPPEEPIYQKLQIRALREIIKVYKGVGLPNVWSVINYVNQLTLQPPLPLYKYAAWSFREIFSLAAVAARSDGSLHLSDLASLIAQTPPLDTAQTGPPFSFRALLEPS
jgi:hypothetical protein